MASNALPLKWRVVSFYLYFAFLIFTMSEKLEQLLWRIADTLRGKMDADAVTNWTLIHQAERKLMRTWTLVKLRIFLLFFAWTYWRLGAKKVCRQAWKKGRRRGAFICPSSPKAKPVLPDLQTGYAVKKLPPADPGKFRHHPVYARQRRSAGAV